MKMLMLGAALGASAMAMGQSAAEKQSAPASEPLTIYRLPQVTVPPGQTLYLNPKLQPMEAAKLEPIPTEWPKLKIEKIPTQWTGMKMVPVESKAAMIAAQKKK
jgi:hypothetical protein